MALPEKKLGPFTFKIDRPKGTVKKWPGGKQFTYPVDYGYFPRIKGEDSEGLDSFVGDHETGHLESFLKLKPNDLGRMVPDETKFVLGVTDQDRETIYRLYRGEWCERKVYPDWKAVERDVDRFKTKRRAKEVAVEKAATLYGVKVAVLENMLDGNVLLHGTADSASPDHMHWAEQADIQNKLQNAWRTADSQGAPGASESSVGALPMDGVIG
jgi:hypothetical protein